MSFSGLKATLDLLKKPNNMFKSTDTCVTKGQCSICVTLQRGDGDMFVFDFRVNLGNAICSRIRIRLTLGTVEMAMVLGATTTTGKRTEKASTPTMEMEMEMELSIVSQSQRLSVPVSWSRRLFPCPSVRVRPTVG
jgi:hypothetical protein